MNCEDVQSLLLSYLNHETTPSERVLIQAHLTGCKVCREELSLLASMQGRIGSALQRRTLHAAPLPDARSRLEARLMQEAQPAPIKSTTWLMNLAPGISQISARLFSGDKTMIRKLILASSVAIAAIAMITIALFNSVPPVSAQTILDRAYQAQSQTLPAQGILHIRHESYDNYRGLPEDQAAGTIQDMYFDLGSCNSRFVTTNDKTGVVLDVHATDGTNIIGGFNYDINASGPLTVYRSPKDPANIKCEKLYEPYEGGDKDVFNQMRSDPNVVLIGQETWADGQTVYVLRSQTPADVMKGNQHVLIPAQTTMYFNTQTFKNLGGKQTINDQAGKEVLLWKKLTSMDEILPAGSPIHWDVSDVKGIRIIDDPDGSHRDDGGRG
jgi:hypothetical protein